MQHHAISLDSAFQSLCVLIASELRAKRFRFNTIGAFHTAIEVLTVSFLGLLSCVTDKKVYGEEWAFYRTPNPTSCGVCGADLIDVFWLVANVCLRGLL